MIDPQVQEDQQPEMCVSIVDAKATGPMSAKKVGLNNKIGDLRETCYRCYKKGHIRKDCPMSRTPSAARK